jgi:hypothetical protein
MPLKRVPNTAIYYTITEPIEPEMQWFQYWWQYNNVSGIMSVACFNREDFLALLEYWNKVDADKTEYQPA